MKKIISLFFILLISFYFSSNAQESLEGTYFKTAPSCFNSNFQLLTLYYHFNLISNPNNNESTPTYRWNSVSTVRFFDTSNNQNGCTNTTSSNAPPSAMIEKYGTFHILNSQDSTQNDGSTSTLYQIGLNTERQIITPLSSEFVDYLTDQNCGGLSSSASSNQPFFWKNGSPQDLSEGCLLIDNNSTTNPNRTSVGFDNIVFGNCKFVTINAQLTNYTINNSDNTTSNSIVLFIPYINILNSENPNYQNDYDRLVCSENYSTLPALGANKTSPNTPTLTSVWTTPCDSNKNSTELFYFTDVDWNVERYYYSDSQCRHIHYITSAKGVYSLSENSNNNNNTNSNRFLGYFNPKDQSILVVDRTQQQLSCISNSNDSLVPVDLGEQGCSDINLLPISECNQAFENILEIQENSLSVGLAPDLLCANNNQNDTSTSTSNSTYTRQNITRFVNEEIIDHSPWVSNCSLAWNYTRTLEFNEPNSFTETFVHYNDNNCSNQFIRVQRSGLFWFTGLSFLVPSTVDTIHQIYSQSITPLSPEGLDYLNNLTGCGNNQTNWELNVQRTFNNDEECSIFNLFSIDSCPYQYGLFSIKNAPHSETGNNTTPEGIENKILYTARRWDNSFNDCLGTGFRPQELSKQFLSATGDDDDDNVESSSIINTVGNEDSAGSRMKISIFLGIFISVLFALVFLF